jgi:hypothetical protein
MMKYCKKRSAGMSGTAFNPEARQTQPKRSKLQNQNFRKNSLAFSSQSH